MFCRFASAWRCVSVAPFGRPVVPDVYRIANRSSSTTPASGSVPGSSPSSSTPGRATPSGSSMSAAAVALPPVAAGAGACDGDHEPPTKTCSSSGSASTRSRTACQRFGSQNSSLAPESRNPNSSSSVFHHAFSGTTTAPIAAAAHHSTTHSTLFAERIATRSPWPMPNSTSAAATRRTSALCSSYVSRRSPWTRKSTPARPSAIVMSSPSACSRFLYICIGTPKTSSVTISNAPPGPVRSARTGSAFVGVIRSTVIEGRKPGTGRPRAGSRRTTTARSPCRRGHRCCGPCARAGTRGC